MISVELSLLGLISGIFIGGTAGYLGSLMLTKRMALVGDALGHVALPGMGLALLSGLDISFGAFLFLLLGIFLIWLFEIKTSLPMEALVGIVFVASLAIGFLIIPEPELLEALMGDISKVSLEMAFASVIFSLLIFLMLNRIYPKMILANISEDLAKSEGIKIEKAKFYLFAFNCGNRCPGSENCRFSFGWGFGYHSCSHGQKSKQKFKRIFFGKRSFLAF